MFLFDFKKTELPEDIKEIEVFNSKLKELMDSDNYISRKDYMSFFNRYEKTYNSLSAIKNAGLLKTYCKKNKISENLVNDFISNYNNLNDMISNRNKSFVLEKMNKEKNYLDEILKDVDPKIRLDEDQRRVILTDEDYCLVIAGAGLGKLLQLLPRLSI